MNTEQLFQSNTIPLSVNGLEVLENRYLRYKPDGQQETPSELFQRVAHCVAKPETNFGASEAEIKFWETRFFRAMYEGVFLPNSPALMNAGSKDGMLSACFVLPVHDSIDSIFSAIRQTAMIQKAGGGTGFDFSELRPKGDFVASSGGETSGPLAFLKVFSEATHAIQQGAFRRGANMGIMRVDHPDILDFIRVKKELDRVTNFNLSVAVPDHFMRTFVKDPNTPLQVRNPRTGKMTKMKQGGKDLTIGEVFDEIIQLAWENGEPGLIFMDRVNDTNPTPQLGEMRATNACGEQPLLPYESCNLASINLSHEKLIRFNQGIPFFDMDALADWVRLAVRFLDNIIESNAYPFEELTEAAQGNRKIGLGVMGFADALYQLGIPYDSEQAVQFGRRIMRRIQQVGHDASRELALERGVFKNWKGSIWERRGVPMRHACVTCVAPTGSISIIAGCSGGIEPNFALAYQRNIMDGKKLTEMNRYFEQKAKKSGFISDSLMRQISSRKGSVQEMKQVPKDIQRIFVTSHDIAPIWHVRMQAAFQEFSDAAVSKTVNLPNDATPQDVKTVFLKAYQLGCKGVTVYRDGSRNGQPMAVVQDDGSTGNGDDIAGAGGDLTCCCGTRWETSEACGKCPSCGQSVCVLS